MTDSFTIGEISPDNFTKQLLIAMPSLQDPNFQRTVTIICEHNQHGAMGIIINQPTSMHVDDLINQVSNDPAILENKSSPNAHNNVVYAGGPVQMDRGFILHDSDQQWESTHIVDNDLKLTTSEDILLDIGRGKGPENCIVALGYAGWSAGQLEQELAENVWLNVPYEAAIIFNTPIEKRWHSAAKKLGIDVHLISNQTGHA